MKYTTTDLAKKLIAFNTIAGGEDREDCLNFITGLLEESGFTVWRDELNDSQTSLVARLHPDAGGEALCFGGHMDTVPLGDTPWSVPPFDGLVRDGVLYGRGSVDMKGGVAAYLNAALELAPSIPENRDLVLHFYDAEETGCEGSLHLTQNELFVRGITGAVVAEPTGNRVLVGHKGALWLRGTAFGKTAHGSMPHIGDNALVKALSAASNVEAYQLEDEDPYLGKPTKVLTTFRSGSNLNSIPDSATFTVDIRTVPGQTGERLLEQLSGAAGEPVEWEILLDVPPFWTDPDSPWLVRIWSLLRRETDDEKLPVHTVQFFTDAAALRQALPDVPIVILGPGAPANAHVTDEGCPVAELEDATRIYKKIIRDWYGIPA